MLGDFLRTLETWPRRHRGVAVVLAAGLLSVLLLLTPLGCSATVIPPAHVTDPVEVYLVDHGRTPSLILPRPDGQMERYVYGDWNWYALGRQNLLLNGVPAMLWPTRGALGRELIEAPADAGAVAQAITVVVQHIYPLTVERARAESLRASLEEHFIKHVGSMVHNPSHALTFVHYPDRYTYFWNSNHKVAQWLRELDCEVRGPTFNSNWTIREPPADRTP
jgi:hypothetical protein